MLFTFINFPATQFATNTLEWTKEAFSDFKLVIFLLAGVGLAFIIVDWAIDLAQQKKNI